MKRTCTLDKSTHNSGLYGHGQANVLGNFQCRVALVVWIIVGQEPTVLAVGALGL